LTPNPIGKVLSSIRKYRVRALLMGGQACILYGAAEFSRDVDLAVRADANNLRRLRQALANLQAQPVYVPQLSQEVLLRGHACHFRAQAAPICGLRIDVMAVMHGCAPFEQLWKRRRRLALPGVGGVNVLALPDLVQAKKTQRDKDWPMVRRLVEVDYYQCSRRPSRAQVAFWLREARTATLLVVLCQRYAAIARQVATRRPAVRYSLSANLRQVEKALRAEEEVLRAADRAYWQPLRAELAIWRRQTGIRS
jgi:hypothetical protein